MKVEIVVWTCESRGNGNGNHGAGLSGRWCTCLQRCCESCLCLTKGRNTIYRKTSIPKHSSQQGAWQQLKAQPHQRDPKVLWRYCQIHCIILNVIDCTYMNNAQRGDGLYINVNRYLFIYLHKHFAIQVMNELHKHFTTQVKNKQLHCAGD